MLERVDNVEQLLCFSADVRAKHNGFLTNFFLDSFKHNIWIANRDLYYLRYNDTYLIVRQSETFCNVFYVGTSIDDIIGAISILKKHLPNKQLMVDVVGRAEQCVPIVDAFINAGYKEASSLVRMIRKTIPIEYDSAFSKIQNASNAQVMEVYKLLHEYFVAELEQIPYVDELFEYARLGHIHVCVDENKVIGFMIYEKNATTLYWRYWFVHPDYRERHIGSLLFHRLFYEANSTTRQLLWVLRTNENAKKRQEHYGFVEENMFDFIMQY